MITRRNFIKQTVAAGVACSIPYPFFAQEKPVQNNMIWANLLHLSYNMWNDHVGLEYRGDCKCTNCKTETTRWAYDYRPDLTQTFHEDVWNTLLKDTVAAGMNMVVIDLGDAVLYESHPEIAVRNAWTPEKLRNELVKMRKLGLEPIPKLNFSATHDAWLGEYHRMVSTRKYYEVCSNLIHEVIDLFDTPRFFHLGMDEEDPRDALNSRLEYVVNRQNDLWWGDLYFLIGEVEKKNVRPWIWSDYAWSYPDQFFKKMPKSVLQSNWYYGLLDGTSPFDLNKMEEPDKTWVKLYYDLETHGYDQVPTGSNWRNNVNMEATVDSCKDFIGPSRLAGFMLAPWLPTMASCLDMQKDAINQMGRAIKKFNS